MTIEQEELQKILEKNYNMYKNFVDTHVEKLNNARGDVDKIAYQVSWSESFVKHAAFAETYRSADEALKNITEKELNYEEWLANLENVLIRDIDNASLSSTNQVSNIYEQYKMKANIEILRKIKGDVL